MLYRSGKTTVGVGARGAPWSNPGKSRVRLPDAKARSISIRFCESRRLGVSRANSPAGHPFRKHSANLRAVSAGLTQAERAQKAAIRRGDDPGTDFAARMHQLMVGLLAEAHLRKIVSDPDGFNAKEQKLLSQERSQLNRWLRAVELAFRRHYAIPIHLDITVSTTASGVPSQYAKINSLLRNDLDTVIQDRNKLAHGQWV